jgi:nitroreductase
MKAFRAIPDSSSGESQLNFGEPQLSFEEPQLSFNDTAKNLAVKVSVLRRLQQLEVAGEQGSIDQLKVATEQSTGPIDKHAAVFEAIKQRRSVGQVTQQEPTRAQIERVLEAATYAPNHHVTEPWHFIVLTGSAREELGNIMATSLSLRIEDRFSEKARMQIARERNKPLRAPVIITATMRVQNLKGILVENIEAAGAAVQNMLLAAEAMGLATLWRTGDPAYDPLVKRWLGLTPEDHIVGFVYVGYPRVVRAERTPTHFSQKTTWLS